jgi:hypothetical protein
MVADAATDMGIGDCDAAAAGESTESTDGECPAESGTAEFACENSTCMLRPLSRRGVTGTLTLRPLRARLPSPLLLELRLPQLLLPLLVLAPPG